MAARAGGEAGIHMGGNHLTSAVQRDKDAPHPLIHHDVLGRWSNVRGTQRATTLVSVMRTRPVRTQVAEEVQRD